VIPVSFDETPYDLKWRMFGIPVRVHPLFWVMAAILSWDFLNAFGFVTFFLAVACIFVSILVHELGHVVAGRYFGSYGHIVLWAFGGLAIGSNQLGRRWHRVVVLLAGPGAQFALYGLLRLATPYLPLPDPNPVDPESIRIYVITRTLIGWLLWINLAWPILNLLPIWPLDGGQISRELITHFTPRNGARFSLHLSIGLCVLVALYALLAQRMERPLPWVPVGVGTAIFFAMPGIQTLQAEEAQRRQFDPWDHERW
jgi:stage IV sporulation protein FB